MKKFLLFLLLIAAAAAYAVYDNGRLSVTDYTVTDSRIPESFDGLKIVQVSDVHDAEFGGEQADLIEAVRRENPDYIFLTGDFIDSNRYDLDRSMAMIPALTGMAEVFYVTGNHEVASNEVDAITSALSNAGVRVLRNEAMVVGSGNSSIAIAGIDDPLTGVATEEEDAFTRHAIERATANVPERMFTILLAHRPEQFGTYTELDIPLVFTGHAHGGQVRIPFVGGLNSPGQGWFPELTSGIHESDSTQLVISRGLGNSQIPLRLLNTPEIVSVTLRSE
ncbi:metallophosphoesterase [Bhargavaea beijingensis]|uniref:Metallophosphoesterase n=1 Tax=Bhargavaea beijingensis TaxID=426756 RepID=A0ABX9ZG02_9BACL|nr:metallophosphoesterase [Bhargavaea beijingensis]MCW1928619.1 metallophosphoesterase [Bhargavaea beijingensis]RSK36678.1 metallophosphoesterase [Bhargavaea beijingensis]